MNILAQMLFLCIIILALNCDGVSSVKGQGAKKQAIDTMDLIKLLADVTDKDREAGNTFRASEHKQQEFKEIQQRNPCNFLMANGCI
jgi:hypothetical protein